MKDKEIKVKALDSIMEDLIVDHALMPKVDDSILFALGTEDTKDQERASLSEYLDSRITALNKEKEEHLIASLSISDESVIDQCNSEIVQALILIKELQTIKEKFNL